MSRYTRCFRTTRCWPAARPWSRPPHSAGIDLSEEDSGERGTADDGVPWLVIVDSGGRITRFDWLRAQPHWRGPIVAYTLPEAHQQGGPVTALVTTAGFLTGLIISGPGG